MASDKDCLEVTLDFGCPCGRVPTPWCDCWAVRVEINFDAGCMDIFQVSFRDMNLPPFEVAITDERLCLTDVKAVEIDDIFEEIVL